MLNNITLREEDAAEVAAGGLTPEQAIRQSIELSTEWFEIKSPEGEVLVYWGYRKDSVISAHAYLWLLSTPAAEKFKVRFARESAKAVEWLFEENYHLTAAVYCEYDRAIRWLEWLGFRRERVLGDFVEMSARRGGAA